MEQRHITGDAASLLARFPDVPVYTAEQGFLRLTGYTLTRRCSCAQCGVPRQRARRASLLRMQSAWRFSESVVDATKIGAISDRRQRLGMDAVLLSPPCCDLLLPSARCAREHGNGLSAPPWATFDTHGQMAAWSFFVARALRPRYGAAG